MAEGGLGLTFKKVLWKLGSKGVAADLVRSLPRGGDEWMGVVEQLFASTDTDTRKIVLDQVLSKGFLERSPKRARLVEILSDVLTNGYGDERRRVLDFVGKNPNLFPVKEDHFLNRIFGLQRSGDPVLANAAEELLPKIGFQQPDRDVYRSY